MSVQKVNSDGSTTLISGSTLWADSPIGTILAYGGATAPSGWLRADGSEVSKTTYSELYSVIGDKYGTPSVNTNFKLPKVLTCGGTDFPINPTNDYYSITYKRSMIVDNELTFEISATIVTQNKACIVEVDLSSLDGLSNVTSLSCTSFSPTNIDLRLSSYDYNTSTKKLTLTIDPNYGSATKSDFSATFNGTLVGYVSDYIIKAKQVALPADLESAVEDAVEEVYGDIIPSDASSSNKLVSADTLNGWKGVNKTSPAYKFTRSATKSGCALFADVFGNTYMVSSGDQDVRFSVRQINVVSNNDAAKFWRGNGVCYISANTYTLTLIAVFGSLNFKEVSSIISTAPSGTTEFDVATSIPTDTVTSGSDAPITSGGVYTALDRPTIDVSIIVSSNTFDVKALHDNYGNGTYMAYGQGNTGHGVIMVSIWTVSSDAIAYVYTKWYGSSTSTGSNNIGSVDTFALETSHYAVINKIVKITPSN